MNYDNLFNSTDRQIANAKNSQAKEHMWEQTRSKAVRSSNHKTTDVIDGDEKKQPKQIVRNIGNITIKSVKVPKVPTEESIRKYKVASWNKRGHVRHNKNGKTVYIKHTICRRKAFEDNILPPQTIINVDTK